MKCLLILLSLAALTWAQGPPQCQCGAFVNEDIGEIEVFPFPPIDVEGCEDTADCSSTCDDEWASITNNGDLDTVLQNGETVGQHICNALARQGHEDFGPGEVYLYYKLCQGPWEYDSEQSTLEVCCAGGEYQPC
ncbi:uncharacterized protein [Procambarus clarkii]|uniref:uncharacterized protein n=1 Tax=Procambarus clarkii TaxID=6728 RepID=UPI003742D1B0